MLRLVRDVLGHDVLGAYQHGSAVLGGVQPTSDIDILVITGRLATLVEKRQLVEGLMAISAPFPPPGPERCVELTVVAQVQVRPWRYPPSFDLQYGEWLRKRFEREDDLPLQAAVNADLPTLLTIVLLGDQPLYGPPPGELLDPVPAEDCIKAMVSDIDVFMDEFEQDTRNLLLRLARIGRPSSRPLSTVRIERPTGRWSDCRRIINSSWSGRGPSILAGSRMNGPIWHPKPAPVRTT